MEQKITPPWTNGLILALALIVLSLITYFAGLSQNKSIQWVQFVIMIGALVFFCINHSKQMNGDVTFGNLFAHGFKTIATTTVIFVIYSYISFKFLFPEIVGQSLDQARIEMEKGGKLSESDIDNALEMTKKFFVPFAIGGIVFIFALIGAIGSLIGAGVAKKNPKPATPFQ